MAEKNLKDIPAKYVWRRQKWYRNGKIAFKACPVCLYMVSRANERCGRCNQLLDWNNYAEEHTDNKKRLMMKPIPNTEIGSGNVRKRRVKECD